MARLSRKSIEARQVRLARLAVWPARMDGPSACLTRLDVPSSPASSTGRLARPASLAGCHGRLGLLYETAVWLCWTSSPALISGWSELKAQMAQLARLAWLVGPDVDPRSGGPTLLAQVVRHAGPVAKTVRPR